MTHLIKEVSAASNEQAQGIDQLNKAVADMDRVTQSNAAVSEESAAASEELNAQAGDLNQQVSDLVQLVGDNKGTSENGHAKAALEPSEARPKKIARMAGPKALAHASAERRGPARAPKQEPAKRIVKPEEVIPLDENDLSEF